MTDLASIEAHEVVLEIRPHLDGPTHFDITLRDEAGHHATLRFQLDLERVLPNSSVTWGDFLRRYASHHSTSAERRAFGDELFRALLAVDDFAATWVSIVGSAATRPLRLLLVLHPGAEPFARLPFELLRDATGDLFARPGSALLRTLASTAPRTATLSTRPRVLLAWASPDVEERIDTAPHVDALRAIHGENLEVLAEFELRTLLATLAAAHAEGRAFQIVQIIAHGREDQGTTTLSLHNQQGHAEHVPGRMLARAMRGTGVELVALCSCQSAIGFASVGQQLLAEDGADLSCVVACQANLPIAGSAELLARFHRLLLDTRDPALALGRARCEAYDQSDAWSVPVLLARPTLRAVRAEPLFGIPPRVSTWQPRDRLVAQVHAVIGTARLVTVVGIPGVGKTELCFEVARRMLERSEVDLALCVSVRSGMQVSQLRAMLAAATGQPAAHAPRELAALLGRGRDSLVVLDNLEDLLTDSDGARELVELLDTVREHAPSVSFLCSSRWPIAAPAEQVVEVGGLPTEIGADLLADELARFDVDVASWRASTADWGALVTELRGHPRATRLLAARFGELRLEVDEALAELRLALTVTEADWTLIGSRQAFASLGASARADLAVLAAAFRLALARVGERWPDAMRALRRLLLFPAGLPERTAVLVAGGYHDASLQQLYDRRLVDWRDRRVLVPMLLRDGSFVAPATGTEVEAAFVAAATGLRDHVAACDEQRDVDDTPAAVARFLAEEPNLVALADHVQRHLDARELLPFAELAPTAVNLLDYADRRTHAAEIAAGAHALARRHGALRLEADNLRMEGLALGRRGDVAAECAAYGAAIAIYREIDHRPGLAECLLKLGEAHRVVDQFELAEAECLAASRLCEQMGDIAGFGRCAKALGEIFMRLDQPTRAIEQFERAAGCHTGSTRQLDLANDLRALGDARAAARHVVGALSSFQSALEIYTRIEERSGAAKCRQGMGNVSMLLRYFDDAIEHYTAAYEYFRSIDDRLASANSGLALGDALVNAERPAEAEVRYTHALAAFRDGGRALGQANCLAALGELMVRRGETAQATAAMEEALPLFQSARDRPGEIRCLRFLGNLHRDRGHLPKATQALRDALRLCEARDDVPGQAECLQRLGVIALIDERKPREAFAFLHAAATCFERVNKRIETMLAFEGCVLAARAVGALDHALVHGSRALQLGRARKDAAAQLRILDSEQLTLVALGDEFSAVASMVCHREVAHASGDVALAAKFSVHLDGNVALVGTERWAEFERLAESIRQSAVADAERRITEAGGSIDTLP